MKRTDENPWLHRFSVLTALAALGLIGIGGLVTSHDAGMTVPDWPNSYGYNMFTFPVSKWVGGIFYEHTHRLWASGVGLMTMILAAWLWAKESRAGVRWLGVAALIAVVLQGVLGGLRVIWSEDQLGIAHAALAQLYFVLLCALVLFTGGYWKKILARPGGNAPRRLLLATTILIFAQLLIAATMRHQHAGLAIPDFPLAYGKIWPDMSSDAVAGYNLRHEDFAAAHPITAFQIGLQMVHRIVAVLILAAVAACAWTARKSPLVRPALAWLGLIIVQAGLGAWTIWSNKAADVATAHVVVGAISLATGGLLTIIAYGRAGRPKEATEAVPVTSPLGQTAPQTV
jgi:cytochrome c oxidase assembly protein subunit 15